MGDEPGAMMAAVSETSANKVRRATWRRWAIAALSLYVVGAMAFLLAGGGSPDEPASRRAAAGDVGPVHEIEYLTLDQEPATMVDFAGQPLIINFFASWCEPCRQEMPDFERFHQDHRDEITVLGLAVEGARPARGMVEETGITFPTGLDQADILIDFGGVGMPSTVFVSADGQHLETHSGVLTYDDIVAKAEELFGS